MRLAPSILSADFARLGEALDLCSQASAELVHLDVMDGHFVPNLTFGPPVIRSLRARTRLALDVHLMIERPGAVLDSYCEAGADRLCFHIEAEPHVRRGLDRIRSAGVSPGLAINPGTAVSALEDALPYCDFVLVMSVDPGFGGQSFLPRSISKVARLKKLAADLAVEVDISVDGGVDASNVAALSEAGASTFICGSAFFGAADPLEAARTIRAASGVTV